MFLRACNYRPPSFAAASLIAQRETPDVSTTYARLPWGLRNQSAKELYECSLPSQSRGELRESELGWWFICELLALTFACAQWHRALLRLLSLRAALDAMSGQLLTLLG